MKTLDAIGFSGMRHAIYTLSFFLATIPAIASSLPQDSGNPVKELSLEELGNVQVTSVTKAPEHVWKTSAAIFVITHDDIERSGATTIPDALRLAPGVEVAQVDGSTWSVGIRGFGSTLSRDVLVLIDGRTVYTPLHAGTYWDTQNVMLEDVDRIEIIRGPGGTIWGPNAVNGVINIITKSSKDTHGAFVSAGGGSVDQAFVNARYGGGNDNGFDYRVYFMGADRGPEFHSDNENFDRWRFAQAGFRTDWKRNDRDTFTLQGDAYDESKGEAVNATSYGAPYSQNLYGDAGLSGGNILGRWQRVFGEGKDLQLQAYYDRTNRYELNVTDLRNTYDVDFLDRFRLPAREQISWGAGARFSEGDNPTVVSGLIFLPQQRTDRLITAFFQDEIEVIKNRLTLSLGTKLLETNYSGVQLQPSGRILYTPGETQTLWAAYTHAVRTPSDVERNFDLLGLVGVQPSGVPFFARFNANPDFESEQLNGYELGYRRLLARKVYLDLASFFNHYSDLFSEDITGAPYVENDPPPTHILLPADFGNGLLGTTEGVEIAPEWKPTNYWRLVGTYSFLEMHIKKSPDSLDIGTAPIIQGTSPQHQATVQSDFDFSKKFTLNLIYRYVSALPEQKVPSYSTGDARFAWKATQQVQLSLVGRNLMQPHHVEFAGDPGPLVGIKRSVYGQITWTR